MGLSLPFILEVVSSTTAYRQDEHEIERVHKNGSQVGDDLAAGRHELGSK
jgi:hypothetical protein